MIKRRKYVFTQTYMYSTWKIIYYVLFCFTNLGIMSCKISMKNNNISFTDITGNIENIKTKINDKNYEILRAEKVKRTKQLWINRQIRQLTPFRNITTDGIDLRMNIPDRILNALDRSISKHSARNEVNYYLNPFITIRLINI